MSLAKRALSGVAAGVIGLIAGGIVLSVMLLGNVDTVPLALAAAGVTIGIPVLHGWLLRLMNEPRPWLVVGPGVLLMIMMSAGVIWWGMRGLFAIPAVACLLAGVVTEPFSRWQVVPAQQSSSAHGEVAPPTT